MEAKKQNLVDIQVHKTKDSKWRAELRSQHSDEILYFYDDSPEAAAMQAISHMKTIGDIEKVELIYNGRAT